MCRNPRNVNVSGFPSPRGLAQPRRVRPELDEPGLVRVKFQGELREPAAQLLKEPFSIVLELEPHDEVVREAGNDDIPPRPRLPPVTSPQVQDIMQIHIRQQRGQRTPLGGSLPAIGPLPVFEHSRVQPLRDQPQDPLIRDPVPEELRQPSPVKVVEGLPALLRASMTSPRRSGRGRRAGCPRRRPLSC
jgi:hypothetical protein